MFKHLFSLLFLMVSCTSQDPYRHQVAICAIFKDEAPWLKEWIDYHSQVLGVQHFYLYNNESSDDYKAVLKPYIDVGLVELIDWDSENPEHLAYGSFMDMPWCSAQLGAYNDCLCNRALGIAKWVAMIDIDEFIVPVKGVKTFYKLLDEAEKHKKGTVSLHWRVYGTSDVEELKPGELLTEKLTKRAPNNHPINMTVKSIHRPEAIEFCLIHVADSLKPGYGAKTFKPEFVRLNHYWARTSKFCAQKRNLSKASEIYEELNQIEDPVILQHLSKIKKPASTF